jgi:hypothetical protein
VETFACASVNLLHARLGHVSKATIRDMVREKKAKGISLSDGEDVIDCDECCTGKQLAKHFQEEYRQQRGSEMSYILTFVGRYSRVLVVTSISSRLSTKSADRVRWLSCHEKGTSKRHSRRSRLDLRRKTTLSSRGCIATEGGV